MMPEVEATEEVYRSWRWLIPATAAIGVVAVIAGLLAWQPWNPTGGESAVARAQDAMAGLQSYRASFAAKEGANEAAASISVTIEFTAPDRYHTVYVVDSGDTGESILIGDQGYSKGQGISLLAMRAQSGMVSSLLTGDAVTRMLGYLKDVEKRPDEAIDGTICFHYRGTIDFEKQYRDAIEQIKESNASKGLPPMSEETEERMLEEARSIQGPQVVDFWAGKSDYLIRQMKWDIHGPDVQDMTQHLTVDFRFSDFNKSITIKEPRDTDGQLLPGWTSALP